MINHQVEIVEEALLVNEYNLIWNKKNYNWRISELEKESYERDMEK